MINRSKYLPFIESYQKFSIRIGKSLLCPVGDRTRSDSNEFYEKCELIIDDGSLFQADPFLAQVDGKTYIFYESLNKKTMKGVINVASSNDLISWEFLGTVLEHETHISFPHVFTWLGEWWMIPETIAQQEVSIYRSVEYPYKWQKERTLLDTPCSDSIIWEQEGAWYMITSPRMESLLLYTSKSPLGDWRLHQCSPIIEMDLTAARPAGPVIVSGRKRYRLAQDCKGTYGKAISAFSIEEISDRTYREERASILPVMGPGKDKWRSGGMHHLHTIQTSDGHWISAMDGWCKKRRIGFNF